MERGSEHPLGEAIWAEATTRGLILVEPTGFQAEAGHGVQAEVEGRSVVVGNVRMFQTRGIQLGDLEAEVARFQSEAKTAMLVAVDGCAAGVIAVADTIKDGSREAIANLRSMGLKVVMITGDNQKTAEAIARQVGVDEVLAEVLPEGKSAEVKKLQSGDNIVAMVGDGVNIPSYQVQAGDVVAIREKSKKQLRVVDALKLAESIGLPDWVSVDATKLEGTFKKVPDRDQFGAEINESLIVELYSR